MVVNQTEASISIEVALRIFCSAQHECIFPEAQEAVLIVVALVHQAVAHVQAHAHDRTLDWVQTSETHLTVLTATRRQVIDVSTAVHEVDASTQLFRLCELANKTSRDTTRNTSEGGGRPAELWDPQEGTQLTR